MNKNKIFFFLLLITGMSSCQKDSKKSVIYPITYSSNLFSASTIKVYTRNGEVTSSTSVNSIINRYQSYVNKLENDKIRGKIVATYLSEDSVSLTFNNVKENKLRSVHEIAGVTFWEKQDITEYGIGPLFKVEDLYTYHPIYYTEYLSQPGSGYIKFAKLKECNFIIKNGGNLDLPTFDFLWIHNGAVAQSISGINNSFTKTGVANFFFNDTMIVQEYKIEMK